MKKFVKSIEICPDNIQEVLNCLIVKAYVKKLKAFMKKVAVLLM